MAKKPLRKTPVRKIEKEDLDKAKADLKNKPKAHKISEKDIEESKTKIRDMRAGKEHEKVETRPAKDDGEHMRILRLKEKGEMIDEGTRKEIKLYVPSTVPIADRIFLQATKPPLVMRGSIILPSNVPVITNADKDKPNPHADNVYFAVGIGKNVNKMISLPRMMKRVKDPNQQQHQKMQNISIGLGDIVMISPEFLPIEFYELGVQFFSVYYGDILGVNKFPEKIFDIKLAFPPDVIIEYPRSEKGSI